MWEKQKECGAQGCMSIGWYCTKWQLKQHQSLQNEEKETSTGTVCNVRRSTRGKVKKDYKAMHKGSGQLLTEGSTEFSAHAATEEHNKEDFDYSIVYRGKLVQEKNKRSNRY